MTHSWNYTGTVAEVLQFIARLSSARIWYDIRTVREDALMVEVHVPGERWEIEFMANGSVEIERFLSTREISEESLIDELFERFSD